MGPFNKSLASIVKEKEKIDGENFRFAWLLDPQPHYFFGMAAAIEWSMVVAMHVQYSKTDPNNRKMMRHAS